MVNNLFIFFASNKLLSFIFIQKAFNPAFSSRSAAPSPNWIIHWKVCRYEVPPSVTSEARSASASPGPSASSSSPPHSDPSPAAAPSFLLLWRPLETEDAASGPLPSNTPRHFCSAQRLDSGSRRDGPDDFPLNSLTLKTTSG